MTTHVGHRHIALIIGLGWLLTGCMAAQTFTTLHNFAALTNGMFNSDGGYPQAGLTLSGNTLYGTGYFGGTNGFGSVFALRTDGSVFTNLHNFTALTNDTFNDDGANPQSVLIVSGNTLYGTAQNGGTNGTGTIFAMNTNGTGFTTLHNFAFLNNNALSVETNGDGAYPQAGLVLSGQTLYGTAVNGGTNGSGTLFALNTNGTGFTTLHHFSAQAPNVAYDETNGDGANPEAVLVLAGNTLYGTTEYGGTNGNGTIFAVNTNGTGFTALYTFTALVPTPTNEFNGDGANPLAGLILSGDTLYGTASAGGTNGNGTIFAINTNGMVFSTLHTFAVEALNTVGDDTNSDGDAPAAGLLFSGNTLYGTAQYGGTNGSGTVFALNPNGTGFTTLQTFMALPLTSNTSTNGEGGEPEAQLIISSNILYGTAQFGGTYGAGTVFSVSLGATVTVAPPLLTIVPSGTNVILTWPTNAAGFTLQFSTNLGQPPGWTTASPAPVIVNTNNAVTNAISGTARFYRLMSP